MKIVILDGYTENPGDLSWEEMEALGELTVYDRTSLTDTQETIDRVGDAEVVITNKTPIPKEVFEKCLHIKYVGVLATGYNVVDVDTAKAKGIPVTNIPTYGTDAVGQFAIALLLEICHHIGHHSDAVHGGRWSSNDDWCFWDYPLIELAGKTMGIVGFGRIGQTTGRIAKALGMNVIANDEFKSESGKAIAAYVDRDTLFAQSDVIALHCPLFPETKGMINRGNIAKMKEGVIILNNSRGPLIVEQDLKDALDSGKVYAAGLDVVSTEPINADNVLLHAKNCFITPHISWAPKESRQRLMNIAVNNLKAFVEGKPVNVVNQQ
ncbi:D-2-hydroxyacid dehydrogenase [Clostridium sp. C105KSO13]|uniref:D-2-hydroxyacid dehydrogenase n=1 Tax=Clostridium sp. C105KSO13 TaxID=1776045 RepID=UPI0007405DA2|nr:D-2-hydroxyacid dehydrogenase [Clostridium sp. C105KSO13]CUX47901.1 Glycerate dehydrogenase [Clostridium sp. C105KSO13]